ncbi:MAG TPA: hypothetical protein VMM36_14345 [Opitutaceae bacterium]|nr:hypothetical protein [Opitutaceae bacterium]
MKRALLIPLAGVLAAVAAHFGWFELRRPVSEEGPAGVLAWLQDDLHLSADQFASIKALHDRSEPQILQLAEQASVMRAELEAFENRRRTDGRVDFLAFAQFIEQRREFQRICTESTRRIMTAAASEMTPGQRARYLERFEPALGLDAGGIN